MYLQFVFCKYRERMRICETAKFQACLPTHPAMSTLGFLYAPESFVGHGKGPVKLEITCIVDVRVSLSSVSAVIHLQTLWTDVPVYHLLSPCAGSFFGSLTRPMLNFLLLHQLPLVCIVHHKSHDRTNEAGSGRPASVPFHPTGLACPGNFPGDQ